MLSVGSVLNCIVFEQRASVVYDTLTHCLTLPSFADLPSAVVYYGTSARSQYHAVLHGALSLICHGEKLFKVNITHVVLPTNGSFLCFFHAT